MDELTIIADKLQTEFCNMAKNKTCDFSVLGADYGWNLPENFNNLSFDQKQTIIVDLAEKKYGELPYNPKLSEDDLRMIQ